MLKPKIQDALNDHINAEIYSAYLYFSMAAYFDQINLTGMAHWMKIQGQEELSHATKIFDFIHERGGKVILGAIAAPPHEWKAPLDAFQQALVHEQEVSARIDALVDLAEGEKDRASRLFLEWFVTEQVEEEANVDAIVQQLTLIEGAPHALFMIDRELAQRPVTDPAAPEA